MREGETDRHRIYQASKGKKKEETRRLRNEIEARSTPGQTTKTKPKKKEKKEEGEGEERKNADYRIRESQSRERARERTNERQRNASLFLLSASILSVSLLLACEAHPSRVHVAEYPTPHLFFVIKILTRISTRLQHAALDPSLQVSITALDAPTPEPDRASRGELATPNGHAPLPQQQQQQQ